MQGTGRRFDGIAVDGSAATRTDDQRVHTCTDTGTGDRTEITHIGHSIEHDEQRSFAFVVERCHQVFQGIELNRTQKSNDALVVLVRKLVEFLDGYFLHRCAGSFEFE